ncbi:hypothetical protein [Streptomyces griseorubiginosus]|uniref:hypothetical protein n=1 Tax=Streptomyces griseorubiginosus TaxID=67304 RepID=UPI0036EE8BE1
MGETEFRDDQWPRLERWWGRLESDDRARALALVEDDEAPADMPADLAESLQAAGVLMVSTSRQPDQSDLRSHQPSLLTEFLTERRQASRGPE